MTLKDMVKWNSRVSAMYAFGMWTMIGSYAIYRYSRRDEDKPGKTEEVVEAEDPNEVVYHTPHSKTTVIYKKDFVPFTSRISNFMKYFSSVPGTGDSDK